MAEREGPSEEDGRGRTKCSLEDLDNKLTDEATLWKASFLDLFRVESSQENLSDLEVATRFRA